MPPQIYDALILGSGPAGLSTALGLARVKRTALVLSNSRFRNDGIKAMHTVLGYDGAHPADFRKISREQIEKYGDGIEFAEGEVVKVGKTVFEGGYEGFEVKEKGGRAWGGRKLLLAMGSRDVFPKIEGYAENWPDNIYQCLFCDGRERSHLPIGAMGFSSAAHLPHAMMIAHLSGDKSKVTFFTNGPLSTDSSLQEAVRAAKSVGCVFETRKIIKLDRAQDPAVGMDIQLEDGERKRVGFLVDKPPTEPVGAKMLVDGLGIEISSDWMGSFIKRSEPFGETSCKGCFVAGDAGTSMKQITTAVSQGVGVAGGISMRLCAEEGEQALARVKGTRREEFKLEENDPTNCVE